MGNTLFDEFCEAMNRPVPDETHVAALPVGREGYLSTLWDNQEDLSILNYAQWIREVRGIPLLSLRKIDDIQFYTLILEPSEALPEIEVDSGGGQDILICSFLIYDVT